MSREFNNTIGGLMAGANPDTKFGRQWAKDVAKAENKNRNRRNAAWRKIELAQKKYDDRVSWIVECEKIGQTNEAERWKNWIPTQETYIDALIATYRENHGLEED